jgi:hypothetical protein
MPPYYIRQFGNIDSQPRFKRRIECYWDKTARKNMPYISPDKHRFTLYQAHLTTNQKYILRDNSFTRSHCGHCGCKGHCRQSCWQGFGFHLLSSTSKMRYQGDDVEQLRQRYILFQIARTAMVVADTCWAKHIEQGGTYKLEYLSNVGNDGSCVNLRVLAYKTDRVFDNRICRCTKCYEYFGKHLQAFSEKVQEQHRNSTPIDTTDLRFLDDTELRNELKKVDIKSDGNCPICMEEVLEVDKVVTKCGHVFCASCLFQNLPSSAACPMCRETLADYTPIHSKITVLEEEVRLLRQELIHRSRVLSRVQTMLQENI